MQYLVLRDCFVNKFYRKGDTVDLPDDMVKSPKNFRPLEQPEPLPVTLQPTTEASKEKVDTISPVSNFTCLICGRECKGKFGLKSHMRSHDKVATKKK